MWNVLAHLVAPRGRRLLNITALVVGIAAMLLIEDSRTGLIVFLASTCVESGLFCLVYGLRSDWRSAAAARAVFWAVLGYFFVSAQALSIYLVGRQPWTDDVRELLYLGLMIAGLNLVATMVDLLGPRIWQRRAPSADSVGGSRQEPPGRA